ncbi:TPA: hypothetical protein PC506_003605 [Clostridioides difficile]|uniref:hypothetical protein n=1 Tax=Clostridioides difficile TaxID=1496 RepID=UPI002A20B924|nr:hypothetical protein [Clostridioides difficile]HEK4907936.1 hypothetical protein [Clostridioides difficile]
MIFLLGKNNCKIKCEVLNIKYVTNDGSVIENSVDTTQLFNLYTSCDVSLFELLDNKGNYLEFIIEDIKHLFDEEYNLELYIYCAELEKTPIIFKKKILNTIDKAHICIVKSEKTNNGRYESLSFPKNWTRKMQHYWLRKHNYPIATEYYNVVHDYFTKEYLSCHVKYKKNIVNLFWSYSFYPDEYLIFNKKTLHKINKGPVYVIKKEETLTGKYHVISFPIDWTQTMQIYWLKNSNYPIYRESYNIPYEYFSKDYISCSVEYSNNIVKLFWNCDINKY